jgi:hypothetical protein
MTDIAPPPASPKSIRKTRVDKLVKAGLPKDVTQAKNRVKAARAKRKKSKIFRPFSTRIEANLGEAIDIMADRYDTPVSAVIRRMLEDGVRKYGNEEELIHAGFMEPKPANPFDPMQGDAFERFQRGTPEGREYQRELETPPDLDRVRAGLDQLPPMFTGGPLVNHGEDGE